MRDNNILILAGAALAGLAYAIGRKEGYNEHVDKCREVLLDKFINGDKKEEEES